jgi:hypothetical protein
LVVNHPVNSDGQAVLASSPEILEECYLGELLGARVEGGKLLVDAWLDVAAIQASTSKGVESMWKRLVDGETVEVSVGAIVYTKRGEGEWEGKKYSGSWDIVIPDHLAFLDGDQVGACSVEDGCGTFRTQSAGRIQLSEGARRNMAGALKTVGSGAKGAKASVDGESREACSCAGAKGLVAAAPSDADKANLGMSFARMLWNADTFDADRRGYMQRALSEHFGSSKMSYVITYNDNVVVYEQYNGDKFVLYELAYESDGDNNCTFVGDPVEVVIQSKTVPVGGKAKEKNMSKALQSLAAKAKKKDSEPDAADEDEEDEGENEGTTSKGKKKKMSSGAHLPTHIVDLAEKLDTAETLEDVQKALSGTAIGRQLGAAMKVCAAARDKAVAVILSSSGGKHFTKEMLAGVEFEALDKMALSFLSADKALEAARNLEEGESEEEGEGEDEESEAEAEAAVEGLSLGFMDYNDALAAEEKKLNGKGGAVASGRSPTPVGNPAKAARLAGKGANFGGRAARGGSGGNVGVPVAPDVFTFDKNGKLVQ